MKVFTLVKYDEKMNEIYAESFDYNGDVALCGGGKSSSPTVPETPDPVQKATTKSVTESSTAARESQAEKAAQARGIKSTLLTDTAEETQSSSKTLLG